MSHAQSALALFQKHVGEEEGVGEWFQVDQARINAFADATLDHQWIHVDEERAASGPFGGTIAHGYLVLSVVPSFVNQVLDVPDKRMGVNYGLGRFFRDRVQPRTAASRGGRAALRGMERWGPWSLVLTPLPVVGDPVTVVAGLARVSFALFAAVVLPLRVGRYVLIAGLV